VKKFLQRNFSAGPRKKGISGQQHFFSSSFPIEFYEDNKYTGLSVNCSDISDIMFCENIVAGLIYEIDPRSLDFDLFKYFSFCSVIYYFIVLRRESIDGKPDF
jgi:hypothetical protein